jgi:hypothetical protein
MTAIKAMWRAFCAGWMRFAHVLGIINTTVLLTLVYLVVVIPTRTIWWILRKDPLMVRRTGFVSMWLPRAQDEPSLDERRHPF